MSSNQKHITLTVKKMEKEKGLGPYLILREEVSHIDVLHWDQLIVLLKRTMPTSFPGVQRRSQRLTRADTSVSCSLEIGNYKGKSDGSVRKKPPTTREYVILAKAKCQLMEAKRLKIET